MSFPNAEDELLKKATTARDDEYRELVERAIRAYELSFGQSPCNGFKASFALVCWPRHAAPGKRRGFDSSPRSSGAIPKNRNACSDTAGRSDDTPALCPATAPWNY